MAYDLLYFFETGDFYSPFTDCNFAWRSHAMELMMHMNFA